SKNSSRLNPPAYHFSRSSALPLFRDALFFALPFPSATGPKASGLNPRGFCHKSILLSRGVLRFYHRRLNTHHARTGPGVASFRRRLPLGMIPSGERSQIAVGARDHDSAAVVVYEKIVVVRPLAWKVDHHLGRELALRASPSVYQNQPAITQP